MSFPTLSKNPSTLEIKTKNNTISIEFDGGYKQTRERNTRDLKTLKATYELLSRDDKDLIEAHIAEVRGSVAFDYQNADTGVTYTVRYTNYPTITAKGNMPDKFDITLEMEEV